MKSKHRTLIFVFTCLFVFSSALVWAKDAPITIEADRMVSLEEDNSVLFTGNVDARQGDVRIRSNKMTVYYTAAADGKKQEVKRLKCVGNVEVTKGEWLGTGKQMNYLAKDRKVILSGNAKAWQDKNLVTGDTIIYYIDEKRQEVVGDRPTGTFGADGKEEKKPSRVKATLIPQ